MRGPVFLQLRTSQSKASPTIAEPIPIVCITGQVPTHLIGNDAFQECDTVGITRPCTKYNYLVKRIEEIGRAHV